MWRDSGKSIKFFGLDGRLIIFPLLLIFMFSMTMLVLNIVALVFFYYLQYKGYTLPNAIRYLNVMVSGRKKHGVHWWRRNVL